MRIAVLKSCEVWCWLIPFSSLNGAWFLQFIFDCASCGAWAPEAWKPRFQIFANLWKFNNRWNLKTWFLKIVYQRVSLSKIWAIHQNGRWRTILDPDRQPFLIITEIHLNASFPVNQLQINGLKLIQVVTELFLLLLLFCFFCTVLHDNVVITTSFWWLICLRIRTPPCTVGHHLNRHILKAIFFHNRKTN